MQRLRFIMIGGFLGAGKTTTLARLARHYMAAGKRVGLVTNDQAQDLVDTNSLRAQGFPVAEVPGACFCCKFDELVGRVGDLTAGERPDIILTEPVGSCTDLVATVVQPLKALYADRFEVAPFAVLFKPSHGRKILRGDGPAGFSPKAAYIFEKQLEEADAIVVNRADELDPAGREELTALVRARHPDTPLLMVSARTGEGFDALTELLDRRGDWGRRILDIDYDTYAAGEAELGWYNGSAEFTAAEPFELDALLLELISSLSTAVAADGGEVAHLKIIGLAEGAFGVANLVAGGVPAELSLPSHLKTRAVDLVVNARVATDPAALDRQVREAVTASAGRRGATLDFRAAQSFRPGRPTPTHRYETPVS